MQQHSLSREFCHNRLLPCRPSHARLRYIQQKALPSATSLPVVQQQPDALAPSSSTAPQPPPQVGHHHQQLFQWVQHHGGAIHPYLAVTDTAPCGCRGIIAAADITVGSCKQQHEELYPHEGPDGQPLLIAVPWELCMSDQDAVQLLSTALAEISPGSVTKVVGSTCHGAAATTTAAPCSHHSTAGPTAYSSSTTSAGPMLNSLQQAVRGLVSQVTGLAAAFSQQERLQQRLRQLQPPMLLALLLAHQRRLGQASFWHPYISSLPTAPPCAWHEQTQQQLLSQQLLPVHPQHESQLPHNSATGLHQTDQPDATVAAAAAAVAAKCKAAAGVFGQALGGISAADVTWAYGHVVSRAYATGLRACSGGQALALVPVVDLLNHAAGAAAPVLWQLGDEAFGAEAQPQQQQQQQQQPQQGGSASAAAQAGREFWCVWHQQGEGAHAPATPSSTGAASHGAAGGGDDSAAVVFTEPAAVTAAAGDEDRVILHAGQELYVSYIIASSDAASAWLSFGFVPPELQRDDCVAGREAQATCLLN